MPQFTPAYSFVNNVAELDAILMESTGHTTQINNLEQDVVYLSGQTSGNTQSIINLNQDLTDLNNVVTGHTTNNNIHLTISEIESDLGNTFEPKKGSDDNYVTDAEKIVIGNTSGTNTGDETDSTIKTKLGITTLSGSNTGDNAINSLYSGLATSKQDTNLMFTNVTASTWVANTTYSGYGYKCDLAASGVTSSMLAEVNLGHTEAVSGNYSPVCVTGTNIVTIYSKVNTIITVPSIIVFK